MIQFDERPEDAAALQYETAFNERIVQARAELDDWQRAQAGRLAQAGHTDAGELLEAVRSLSARALAG